MDSIYVSIKATIAFNAIQKFPNITTGIKKIKDIHELTFTEVSNGVEVTGELPGIYELEQFIKKNKPIQTSEHHIIRSAKGNDVIDVTKFFGGTPWSFVSKDDQTTSIYNLTLDPNKFCYLLLDKSEQLKEILKSNKAGIVIKEFQGNKLRVKVTQTRKDGQDVKAEIEKMCEASTAGMKSIDRHMKHLAGPLLLCDQIEEAVKPHLIFLRRATTGKESWDISVLVLESHKDRGEKTVDGLIDELCTEPIDAEAILAGLCDQRLLPQGSKAVTPESRHAENHFDNGENHGAVGGDGSTVALPSLNEGSGDTGRNGPATRDEGSSHLKREQPQIPCDDSRELRIGDEDIIDYMLKFHTFDIHKIEKENGVEVISKNKSNGILELKPMPAKLGAADLKITHLAQDIFMHKSQEIDLSQVNPTIFHEKSKEALRKAQELAFLVREKGKKWWILGPDHKLNECVLAIKACFGLGPTRRRRMLANSMVVKGNRKGSFEVLGSKDTSFIGNSHVSLAPGKPQPKVYHITESDILVYAWVTDITKLRVDAVVNAANERLQHEGGVAYAIAKAAGKDLQTESKKYIQNYGKLKLNEVCSTTSGNMPCKRVLHTVGPIWSMYADKAQCSNILLATFRQCLENANNNKYASIAFPAISSGIYGVPKTVVADMAVNAIAVYASKYPYSTLNFIHLVDILDDTVACFQAQLETHARSALFKDITLLKSRKDFDCWIAGSSSSLPGHSLTGGYHTRQYNGSSHRSDYDEVSLPHSPTGRYRTRQNTGSSHRSDYDEVSLPHFTTGRYHTRQKTGSSQRSNYDTETLPHSPTGRYHTTQNTGSSQRSSYDEATLSRQLESLEIKPENYQNGQSLDNLENFFRDSLNDHHSDAKPETNGVNSPIAERGKPEGSAGEMDWETSGSDTIGGHRFGHSQSDEGTDVDQIPKSGSKKSQAVSAATYAQVIASPAKTDVAPVHAPTQAQSVRTKIPSSSETKGGDIPDAKEVSKVKEREEENCSICLDKPTDAVTLPKCKHTFCKACIEKCFDKMQPKCPNCGVVYGELRGDQPDNGTMKCSNSRMSLPGYERYGSIEINYYFPSGKQTEKHPNPGQWYSGTSRTAYLPDNVEGRKVLALLKRAFDARMVFTVGTSSTTGRGNCVIWNCIHHKTSTHGGPQSYGYPDPTYLNRVQEELAAQGFK